jgi:hypothetical protein
MLLRDLKGEPNDSDEGEQSSETQNICGNGDQRILARLKETLHDVCIRAAELEEPVLDAKANEIIMEMCSRQAGGTHKKQKRGNTSQPAKRIDGDRQ